jgi:uncharacterized protein (TIGR02147 family)
MTEHEVSYRTALEHEFEARKQRNPGYSLRAYARDLDMPPTKLSEVLRGKCGLSARSATAIAKKIKLSREETEWFVLSVEAHHSRSPKVKRESLVRLQNLENKCGFDEISLEQFKIISDWYHFAILELTETEGFQSSPKWIASRLGISTKEAFEAIQRLLDFGLLQKLKSGSLKQTKADLITPHGIPSREMRKHHSQIIMKALDSLDVVPVEQRDVSSLTMSFTESQVAEARRLIKEFYRKFDRVMKSPGGPKDRVYSLAIQFFPLDIRVEE